MEKTGNMDRIERALRVSQRTNRQLERAVKEKIKVNNLLHKHKVIEKKLREKLDEVWNRIEEEKDLVMLVTKAEVEKAKDVQIKTLTDQLKQLLALKTVAYNGAQESAVNSNEAEKREWDNERAKFIADLEIMSSKVERSELENKRLKDELSQTQNEQLQ